MVHTRLDGELFSRMMFTAANFLHTNTKLVDSLNVFPVPDGDTGTNMNLTFSSGVDELSRKKSSRIGEAAAALAKGLLMGARGNSGVILSQLFRGFSKAVAGKESIQARQFADALKAGVDAAYQAVMKPVEGTILTVAREAAEMAIRAARTTDDIVQVMKKTYEQAQATLLRTPEYLPVLKEVGVVDSGGQGLVFLYEGFLDALRTESSVAALSRGAAVAEAPAAQWADGHPHAQAHMKTEEIVYGYCTEFMVALRNGTEANKKPFLETAFRARLNTMGDSLLVVADDELVKVHIHAEHPGQVLEYAQQFGSLHRIKIENMREQHSRIVQAGQGASVEEREPAAAETGAAQPAAVKQKLSYGLIAVAAGSGIADMFRSMGVHVVVEGGQTMNPSTEDFLNAIRKIDAQQIILLPNNSNIVMAAEQAASLAEVPVAVIPTKSVPQGMAALIAFNAAADLATNEAAMQKAIQQVKTGQVTRAVRDTKMGEVQIREGDFIGIAEKEIVIAGPDLMDSAKRLLLYLADDTSSFVTIIYGDEADKQQAEALLGALAEAHPDVEAEVLEGRQPLYPFIFAVE